MGGVSGSDLRPARSCCYCGRSIASDHNLAEWNLIRHEESCLDQQRREQEKAARAQSRAYRRKVAKSVRQAGFGSVPTVGQLGFPGFKDVPEEVVG